MYNQIAAIYKSINKPVPYRFIDVTGKNYSMDKGCLRFIGPDERGLAEYVLEDGYIVAIKPKPEMMSELDQTNSIAADIDDIIGSPDIPETERKQLINARVGQGKFRDDVLNLWGNACAVTGCTVKDAIRASHIIPWKTSNSEQRLDPENGLPLVATLDALFDRGLISFGGDGRMLISKKLSEEQQKLLLLLPTVAGLLKTLSVKTSGYLVNHRQKFDFD